MPERCGTCVSLMLHLMRFPQRTSTIVIPSKRWSYRDETMVNWRIKYVVEDVDRHGNVRIYFRRPGYKKIRLRGPPGSEEFQIAYAAALEKTQSGEAARKPCRLNVDRWAGFA